MIKENRRIITTSVQNRIIKREKNILNAIIPTLGTFQLTNIDIQVIRKHFRLPIRRRNFNICLKSGNIAIILTTYQ